MIRYDSTLYEYISGKTLGAGPLYYQRDDVTGAVLLLYHIPCCATRTYTDGVLLKIWLIGLLTGDTLRRLHTYVVAITRSLAFAGKIF